MQTQALRAPRDVWLSAQASSLHPGHRGGAHTAVCLPLPSRPGDHCAHCSGPHEPPPPLQACSPGLPGALSVTPAAVASLAWAHCANRPAVERVGAGRARKDREGRGEQSRRRGESAVRSDGEGGAQRSPDATSLRLLEKGSCSLAPGVPAAPGPCPSGTKTRFLLHL